jgi:hypothetical protein
VGCTGSTWPVVALELRIDGPVMVWFLASFSAWFLVLRCMGGTGIEKALGMQK